MSNKFSRELPFGATILDDGRVRFRLWAPGQTAVEAVLEGGGTTPMQRTADGWFEAIMRCDPGTRYRYRLADGSLVPDPASRAQADDIHGPSVVVDPGAYQWRNPGWTGRPWHETVLYEVHPGLLGGFSGVARELPRLAELGVTAIELMPINDFPGRRNWGYDGVLPYAPDAAYGCPGHLKALVDAAHDCGLMIFLDVVYNHFGPDGNYLHQYAPQMFREDIHTPWGAAIDFRRPEVRRFFTENALYWLMEYRFDGLRFDAVHAISETDWLDEMAAEVRATVEPGRHVHLVLENERNAASHLAGKFDAQWNDDGHQALHVLLTGETEGYYQDFAEQPTEQLARVLAEGFVFQGQVSPYHGHPRGEPSTGLPPTAFVLFLQNHDQIGNRAMGERLTVLAEPHALEAATALQLLCPQIPLIFMGEEDASRSPFLFFTDHGADLADVVREGRRREFAKFAAFTDPAKRAQIPDPNDPVTFQRSLPRPDPNLGVTRRLLYRRLLAIRQREVVPRVEETCSLDAKVLGPAAVCACWRLGDGAVLTIAANLGEDQVSVENLGGRVIFATSDDVAHRAQGGTLDGYSTVALLEKVDE
jgi:malto-oligosyltrehalose trehalohydrolase